MRRDLLINGGAATNVMTITPSQYLFRFAGPAVGDGDGGMGNGDMGLRILIHLRRQFTGSGLELSIESCGGGFAAVHQRIHGFEHAYRSRMKMANIRTGSRFTTRMRERSAWTGGS